MNLSLYNQNQANRSHSNYKNSFEDALRDLEENIINRGDLPYISIEKQLHILRELSEFPFGRYMIERKGANGFWTDYLINFFLNSKNNQFIHNSTEDFIIKKSLIVLAHRERFRIYQDLIKKELQENAVLASIPCGLMRDLISLDFVNIKTVKLVGVDLDQESLYLAQLLAEEHHLTNTEFFLQDAWKMQFFNTFDVITSSGLNVYESDPQKILDLYRLFFNALKPGGALIISLLTYPPGESKESDWNLDAIPKEDLLMEKILYKDILNLHWRNFRSSSELRQEFEAAGFVDISVYFDKNRIFPTIFARKPKNLSES